MEEKSNITKQKLSVKDVLQKTNSKLSGHWKSVLCGSVIHFAVFLAVFILTNSYLLSFISFGIFLSTQISFLISVTNNENAKLENIFKLGPTFLTALTVSLVFFLISEILFFVLIIPVFAFLCNYIFVFNEARTNNSGTLDCFKKSRENIEGYKGKMLLLLICYTFMFCLLCGFFIALLFLFGRIFVNIQVAYVNLGILMGLFTFLIFIMPVLNLSIVEFSNQIKILNEEKNNPVTVTILNRNEEEPKPDNQSDEPDNNSNEENVDEDKLDVPITEEDEDITNYIV